MTREVLSWTYLVLISSSLILPIFAYERPEYRKFASKPSELNTLEYASQYNNRIDTEPVSRPSELKKDETFSWQNIMVMGLQFLYNILNPPSVEKSDGPLLQDGEFTWVKLLSVIIRVALAGLGSDTGIDKSDNPSTPLENMLTAGISMLMGNQNPSEVQTMAKHAGQLINLVVTLMDALRTSFSQRSFRARAMGGAAPVSDAMATFIGLAKGYVEGQRMEDENCQYNLICTANTDCELQGYRMGCTIGSTMMAYGLGTFGRMNYNTAQEAARRGRVLEDCRVAFPCNKL